MSVSPSGTGRTSPVASIAKSSQHGEVSSDSDDDRPLWELPAAPECPPPPPPAAAAVARTEARPALFGRGCGRTEIVAHVSTVGPTAVARLYSSNCCLVSQKNGRP